MRAKVRLTDELHVSLVCVDDGEYAIASSWQPLTMIGGWPWHGTAAITMKTHSRATS